MSLNTLFFVLMKVNLNGLFSFASEWFITNKFWLSLSFFQFLQFRKIIVWKKLLLFNWTTFLLGVNFTNGTFKFSGLIKMFGGIWQLSMKLIWLLGPMTGLWRLPTELALIREKLFVKCYVYRKMEINFTSVII